MSVLTVTRALYHHCQDTDKNCGRACAQMIISSFVQSPFAGAGSAAPAAATPIVVTQGTLKSREPESSDTLRIPQWFTHPDELLILMTGATEYTLPADRIWHIADRDSVTALLGEVIVRLKDGLPSIININGSDHWVVVVGAQMDAGGNVVVLEMRDPLPDRPVVHTYIDECNDPTHGETFGAPWHLDVAELGSYQLQIGDVPPPPGMTDFKGRYVGIVHGPTPNPYVLDAASKKFKHQRPFPSIPPPHPEIDPRVLTLELHDKAVEWNVAPLHALLETNETPVVRLVEDMDGSLCAGLNRRGVVNERVIR